MLSKKVFETGDYFYLLTLVYNFDIYVFPMMINSLKPIYFLEQNNPNTTILYGMKHIDGMFLTSLIVFRLTVKGVIFMLLATRVLLELDKRH